MVSRTYIIDLLPALPKAWATGSVSGLRARGGFEVDVAWKDGKLTKATIRNVSARDGECAVRCGNTIMELKIPPGASRQFSPGGKRPVKR
jgi:alpha-L-fucosidase 2